MVRNRQRSEKENGKGDIKRPFTSSKKERAILKQWIFEIIVIIF